MQLTPNESSPANAVEHPPTHGSSRAVAAHPELGHRSGVAARLAGIPVETLRVWERRYGVVRPRVSPRGQRLYSSADIRRLALIKQLVDRGHGIGTVAALPVETLMQLRTGAGMSLASGSAGGSRVGEARRAAVAPTSRVAGDGADPIRVRLVGAGLPATALQTALNEPSGAGAPRVVIDASASIAELREAASAEGGGRLAPADFLLLELATLNDDSTGLMAQAMAACGAQRGMVLYRFGPGAVIRRLRAAGFEVARTPPDARDLALLARALLQLPSDAGNGTTGESIAATAGGEARPIPAPPPARFDAQALATLAGMPTGLYCECSHHVAELVSQIQGFERYSGECASRDADDAMLHRDLQRIAGHARSLLEDALLRVAVAEKLPLPPHLQASARR